MAGADAEAARNSAGRSRPLSPARGVCAPPRLPAYRRHSLLVCRSLDTAPHGIAKLRLVADRHGRGQAVVVGRGAALSATPSGLPALPLPGPLELQVQRADTGVGCLAIEIPAAGVRRNDAASGRFLAHGAP